MKELKNLTMERFGIEPIGLKNYGINEFLSKVKEDRLTTPERAKVNIIALGDVGTNVLMGLRLLGGDVIGEIGIYDLNEAQLKRLEMELNQMRYPHDSIFDDGGHKTAHCIREMPRVKIVSSDEELMDCDVLVFCATKAVPEIGASGDVRMAQLEANLGIVRSIGEKIRISRSTEGSRGFDGMVAVVSDPVDQLCKGMLDSSGLEPGQIRGFGLGVMAARARYFAERKLKEIEMKEDADLKVSAEDAKEESASETKVAYERYLTEGRAYGPHGQDLVIANSIENYDDDVSRELTKLTVEANLRVRDLGFKPFLAPAISSATLSIILTLRGEWNYGSVFFGTKTSELCIESREESNEKIYEGAYVGVLSRLGENGVEYEERKLPEELYIRIQNAYINLL